MELILLWGFCAIVSACIASGKGRSGFGWFILGALFGPLAMIAVGLMGKVSAQPELPPDTKLCPFCHKQIRSIATECRWCGKKIPQKDAEEETKLCPFCAETIKKAAIVCKHCGRDLPKEEAPAVE